MFAERSRTTTLDRLGTIDIYRIHRGMRSTQALSSSSADAKEKTALDCSED